MSDSVGLSHLTLDESIRGTRGLRRIVWVLAFAMVLASIAGGLVAALQFDISKASHSNVPEVSSGSEIRPSLLDTRPSPPRNLRATGGDGWVDLTWDPPADNGGVPITAYVVYRGEASGGETELIVLAVLTAWRDVLVTNGQTYYYQVAATNVIGTSDRSGEASATPNAPATKPGAPQGLSATPGDTTVSLRWSPPSSNGGAAITNYKIHRGESPGSETEIATIGTEVTYTDTGRTNGHTYYYKVSAVNRIGEGPLSGEASATPNAPATKPSAPQGLSATPSDGTVALAWSAPSSTGGSPITHYRIYRSESPGAESQIAEIGTARSYSDNSVTNGVTYYYKVSAVNSVGEGPLSGEASAKPMAPATVPSAPQDLRASAGDATVRLDWSPPSSNGGSSITNYLVYRRTSSDPLTLVATIPGDVLSYTDSSLQNGRTYSYQVSAKNAKGEGPKSNEAPATPAAGKTAPSPPRGLSAVPGDALIRLTWLAPTSNGGSPITNYNVYRRTDTVPRSLLVTVGNVTSYTDTTVTNGVLYYYVVRAVNALGESGGSTEVSATPAVGTSPPDAPQNFLATPGNGTATLTWSAPSSNGGSPITGYTIYRGTNSGSRSDSVKLGVVTTYTDDRLTNGQAYYYVVTATNAKGEGPPSKEASATPATTPNAPRNLHAIAGNGNVTIQWSGPDSNGGAPVTNYNIYRGTVSGSTTTLIKTVGPVDSYLDSGLTNGQTYFYTVTAVNRVGTGPRSTETSAAPTAAASAPSAPRNLVATAGNGVVTLRWSAPAADGGSRLKNYTVYRGVSPGNLTVLVPGGLALSLLDGGLTNGVTYFYEVSAINAVGEGPRSDLVRATPKAPGPGTDTTKPTIEISSPMAGAVLPPGPTTIRGNASDDVGLARVEVSTNGINWTVASGAASWTATINLTVGARTIYARATDGAANMNTAIVKVTVSGDTGTLASGGDIPRSLIITAVLSFALAAGIAWFVLDRRRKESARPRRDNRTKTGRP